MKRGLSSQVLKILLVLPLLAVRTVGAQGNPDLQLSFEEDAVVASGLPPGGQLIWFGVAREISEHTATIVRRQDLTADDDHDGTVRLKLDRPVPFQSIWVAIDLATGAAAVATPEGYPLRLFELPSGSVGRSASTPDWVEDDRGYVEVLLVRPGQGAWVATVGDGGEADDDGAYDGRLVASLASLSGVGPNALGAPEHFSTSDVVVVIDPNLMEVGLSQLAEVAP